MKQGGDRMTNAQAAALLEAVRIIIETTADDAEKLKSIDRIQRNLYADTKRKKPAPVNVQQTHTEAGPTAKH